MMKTSERGEVATLLTIGALVVISVTAVVSSFFVNQKKTTGSRASGCVGSNQVQGNASTDTCYNLCSAQGQTYVSNSQWVEGTIRYCCCKTSGGGGGGGGCSGSTPKACGTACCPSDNTCNGNTCVPPAGGGGGGGGGGGDCDGNSSCGHCIKLVGPLSLGGPNYYQCGPGCGMTDSNVCPSYNHNSKDKSCASCAGGGGGGGGCSGSTPKACGTACCPSDNTCNGNTCVPPAGGGGGGTPGVTPAVNQNPPNWGVNKGNGCGSGGPNYQYGSCYQGRRCVQCQHGGKWLAYNCFEDDKTCTGDGGGGDPTYCNNPLKLKTCSDGTHKCCDEAAGKCIPSGNQGAATQDIAQCTSTTSQCTGTNEYCGGANGSCNTGDSLATSGKVCNSSIGAKCCVKKATPTSVPTKPNVNCISVGDTCSTSQCHQAGEYNWSCANDGYWCCPPAGTGNTPCTGKTPYKCNDATNGYCKDHGGGGKDEYLYTVGTTYYSGANCSDVSAYVRSYCGCGTTATCEQKTADCQNITKQFTYYKSTDTSCSGSCYSSTSSTNCKTSTWDQIVTQNCTAGGADTACGWKGPTENRTCSGTCTSGSCIVDGSECKCGTLPATCTTTTGESLQRDGKLHCLNDGKKVGKCIDNQVRAIETTCSVKCYPNGGSNGDGCNDPAAANATIQTNQPTDISINTARLSGSVGSVADFQTLGFNFNGTKYPVGVATPFSYFVTGLTADTQYSYSAYGSSNGVEKTGNTVTFRTAIDGNSAANRCKSILPCGITNTCGATALFDVPSAFTKTCSGYVIGYSWTGTRHFYVSAKDTDGNCVIACTREGDTSGTYNGSCTDNNTCFSESTVGPRLDFSVYSSVSQSCFNRGYKLTGIGVQSTDGADTTGKGLSNITQNVTEDFNIIPKQRKESYTFRGWLNYTDDKQALKTVFSTSTVISSVDPPRTSIEVILSCE